MGAPPSLAGGCHDTVQDVAVISDAVGASGASGTAEKTVLNSYIQIHYHCGQLIQNLCMFKI